MPTTSRIAPRRRAPAAARCGRGAPQRAHVFVKEPAPARGGVTIVGGAGRVGAALAHTLLATVPAVTRLVLVDIDTRAAAAQAADLAHAAVLLRSPATVAAGLEASAGCDVLVLCAGAAQATPGESRLMLAGRNTAVCRSALPPAAALSPDAVLVVVTNPCDIVASVAASLLPGWPPGRVLGSGTVLDSARLAFELASASAVSPLSVAAPVLGEHGDSSVALWGAAAVGCLPAAAAVPPPSLDAMACRMRTAGGRIIQGKGHTCWGIAAAVAALVATVLSDAQTVLTVSVPFRRLAAAAPAYHGRLRNVESLASSSAFAPVGPYDVFLSVPAVVGRQGAARLHPTPLTAVEEAGLVTSAQALRPVLMSSQAA